MYNRQTELLVDINVMVHNYNELKRICKGKEILPVLKANGYGIGEENVKMFIEMAEIKKVGLAIVDEGVYLRDKQNYKGEIIILNQPLQEEIENILKYDITTGVCYINFVKELNQEAKIKNKKAKIHIEIETGMGRTGISLKEIPEFICEIKKLQAIEVEGIYTHFSTSGSDLEYMNEQIEKFSVAVKEIKSEIEGIKYVHACNSEAILNADIIPGNMVRPGMALHGYLPIENMKKETNLRPTCKLRSKILFIKEVEKGTSISYDRKYITTRKEKIANVSIGYADGIKTNLSNKGEVVINGKKAPIVGKVCMDSFMVNITNIENVKIGDEVYIWDNDIIKLEDIAREAQTNNYDIMTSISNRVIKRAIS